jgi:hypothetical protein
MKTISNYFREAAAANPFEVAIGGGASGDGIRFIVVSVTIPNVEDIAEWLGGGKETAAVYFKFGEEKRRVQLQKVVMGFPPKNANRSTECTSPNWLRLPDDNG